MNPIGPRMHPNDGRVVSIFIVLALKGEPIPLRDGLVRTIDYFRAHSGVLLE